jgi:arabinose-5-phosphate isomerase
LRALERAARDVVAEEAKAVASVADQVGETFETVVGLILRCSGKVITTGAGLSGSVAKRLAHILSVSGTPSFFLSPSDALHGSLGAVAEGDVVILISKGGATAELNEFCRRARVRGAATVALTSQAVSELVQSASHVVILTAPPAADVGGLIATGTTLAMCAWGDALAVALMRIRRYSWHDLLFSHPLGLVGTLADAPKKLEPLEFDIEGTELPDSMPALTAKQQRDPL